jgi:hypothetical protein
MMTLILLLTLMLNSCLSFHYCHYFQLIAAITLSLFLDRLADTHRLADCRY